VDHTATSYALGIGCTYEFGLQITLDGSVQSTKIYPKFISMGVVALDSAAHVSRVSIRTILVTTTTLMVRKQRFIAKDLDRIALSKVRFPCPSSHLLHLQLFVSHAYSVLWVGNYTSCLHYPLLKAKYVR